MAPSQKRAGRREGAKRPRSAGCTFENVAEPGQACGYIRPLYKRTGTCLSPCAQNGRRCISESHVVQDKKEFHRRLGRPTARRKRDRCGPRRTRRLRPLTCQFDCYPAFGDCSVLQAQTTAQLRTSDHAVYRSNATLKGLNNGMETYKEYKEYNSIVRQVMVSEPAPRQRNYNLQLRRSEDPAHMATHARANVVTPIIPRQSHET